MAHEKEFSTTYWVCVDCHLDHHVGDEHEPAEGCVPWSLIEPGQTMTNGIFQKDHECGWEDMTDADEPPCDGECEMATFSKTPCDGCGSYLAGERYAYTVWTPEDH